MKLLSDSQKNFLCDQFFYSDRYPGWRNIAMRLLEDGECIVGSSSRIWDGGVGNFIEMQPSDVGVGCTRYTFDLDRFLRSAMFLETQQLYLEDAVQEMDDLREQLRSFESHVASVRTLSADKVNTKQTMLSKDLKNDTE